MPSTPERWFFSFPVQLILLHLRSNLLLLGFWIFLLLMVADSFGSKYGMAYLFLSPEYLGRVNFTSFFFLGLGFAWMMMSWNLTVYMLNAHRFPFLATLERPFVKFCLNNLLLPAFFASVLLVLHIRLWVLGPDDVLTVLSHVLGFLAGLGTLVVVLALYFVYTNRDIRSFLSLQRRKGPEWSAPMAPGRRPFDEERSRAGRFRWRVDYYLTEKLHLRRVRSVEHYDMRLLLRVFRQNHQNALLVQVLSVVVLLGLGLLIDRPYFRVPAGTSIFLLASILISFVGAVSYWFHAWRLPVFVGLVLGFNFITRFPPFHHANKAYGLDYESESARYSYQDLLRLCEPAQVERDRQQTLEILEAWKARQPVNKPRMVLYCASGGGTKASVWAMHILQQAERESEGKFMRQIALMSGASGGMLGIAYFRDLYWQQQSGQLEEDLSSEVYMQRIGADLLNAAAFSIVSNDLFLPSVRFAVRGKPYVKDRGYAFERQFSENLGYPFPGKPLSAYRQPEREALIPMLFITPSVVNDGRSLVISPQPVSYMMTAPGYPAQPGAIEIDAVDFGRLFGQQDADSLLFSSALRMSATFPYILPNVHLPTSPGIEVVDAGFRDNFGIRSAARFVQVFKDWILENTSGVVLVQVTGFDRSREVRPSDNKGVFESIFTPLGLAGKIVDLQFFEHDNNLGYLYTLLGPEHFEVVRFTYLPGEHTQKAPISFYLTAAERQRVMDALDLPGNEQSMKRLLELLD